MTSNQSRSGSSKKPKMNMSKAGVGLAAAFMAWMVIANLVFSFRHPWATETEKLLNIVNVLTFQSLDYDEMRPRGATE